MGARARSARAIKVRWAWPVTLPNGKGVQLAFTMRNENGYLIGITNTD
jgi:hypothetical protein